MTDDNRCRLYLITPPTIDPATFADPLAAAKRELEEETGFTPPEGPYHPLGEIRQKGGKRVLAWAVEADFDPVAQALGLPQQSEN